MVSTILPPVAILGSGNMGGAILSGLRAPGVDVESIRVTTRSATSAAKLREDDVQAWSLEEKPEANAWALEQAGIVVLGVKPYQILELLTEIAPHANADAVMVSVAAGITIESMESVWPGAVIRAMPNTPSRIGKGVTGMSTGSRVSATQTEMVERLFATIGEVLVVPQSQINALGAFSGSGPAYVYFFMEKFLEVALERGFSEQQAEVLVRGTFSGALTLLEKSGETPEALRTAVTSPGGSTRAALDVFDAAGLDEIIREATTAAIARAVEMAGE
jgi:pyrroline-5-carboxylate reductase